MDKNAAINLFIKTYYKLLTDKKLYDRETIKKIKHDVFIDKYKISGSVKDKEIAEKLVPLIIKNHGISTIKQLHDYIQENTFLKYSHINAEDYKIKLQILNKEFIDQQIIMKLDEEQQIEVLKEQIIKQREPELMAEIEIKKRQREVLDKELISILDELVFEEPISYDISNSQLEWWEELNLTKNPFPSSNGFSMIDENLFEKILVDTSPFQWMIKKLSTNSFDFFGKGFLVEGALGTGKTTFYDYFKPKFILKKIEPIRIIIPEKISVPQYNADFENQITKKIINILHTQNIKSDSHDYEELMLELQVSKGTLGFIIFIDDLHKAINPKVVYDFLSSLQLFKNRFLDNGINVAFFISGLPEWRERIKLDQKLTSFFDGPFSIIMPQVDPNQAALALQKRLIAYSKSEKRSFQISNKFLNYIFSNEQRKRITVGFRAYIEAAKQHFESKQFDVLGLAPTIIPQGTLEEIIVLLNGKEYFKDAINKLIYSGGKLSNNTINKCLDLLRHIHLETYVLESDPHFLNNKNNTMILKRLADSNLLLKSKVEKGAWKLHPLLVEINEEIKSKYNYSLEDYLIQIYGISELRKINETQDSTILYRKKIRSFSAIINPSAHSILEKLSEEILIIYQFDTSSTEKIIEFLEKNNLTVERIRYLITSLAFFILDFESPILTDIFGKKELKNWSIRFRNLEYFPDFLQFVAKGKDLLIREEETMARILSTARKSFEELICELEVSISVKQLVDNIPLQHFNRNMIKNLYVLSDHIRIQSFENDAFFELSRKFCGNIESSFKEYLFIASKLILGDKRFEEYPANISLKNYGLNFSGSEDCYNEFNTLERSGFSKIFMTSYSNNSSFYKYIIQPITSTWQEKDLKTFYELFISFDKILSHNEKEEIVYVRKHIKTFINLSCKLISDMSIRLQNIIFTESFIFKKDDDVCVSFTNRPRGATKVIEDDSRYINSIPKTICISKLTESIQECNLFLDSFFAENCLEVDLANLEEVRRIVPGNNFAIQIGTLIYLIRQRKIKPHQVYGLNYYFKLI